tara:strand:- start:2265 stop:3065 length:801 start_codon:yes stop_codon:yes gene_type:complete
MAFGSEYWGCEVHDLFISRGDQHDKAFELRVPSLSLCPLTLGANKLPIMGVSGAGKSTLMNVIAAIEWPHSASSKVTWTFPDGEIISWSANGPDPRHLKLLRRQYFGFAFQASTLIPHLTILDNLTYPLEIGGYSRNQARHKAVGFLERVVLDDVSSILEQYPHQLSGGEKQRVALIQSLVHDPTVLFADEPTGSLDPVTRSYVMGVLVDWVASSPQEKFLIWVTHHADDPQEYEITRRLSVFDGTCHWQDYENSSGDWINNNANI